MAPKPRRDAPSTAPDGPTNADPRRPVPDGIDSPPGDRRKDGRLETYEQEVERAAVETLAGHPEGSAPPLERLVDAHPEKQRE